MARPLRIEFAGALYHVTSRGDGRDDIFLDEEDRELWLDVLETVCKRFNWVVHAYCQMGNHYHILIETLDGNLSKGMRQLNGVYTQRFNRTHNRWEDLKNQIYLGSDALGDWRPCWGTLFKDQQNCEPVRESTKQDLINIILLFIMREY